MVQQNIPLQQLRVRMQMWKTNTGSINGKEAPLQIMSPYLPDLIIHFSESFLSLIKLIPGFLSSWESNR